MIELLALAATAITGASGLLALLFRRRPGGGERLASAAMVIGAVCGIAAASMALHSGGRERSWPWAVPGAAFSVRIDPLAAMFLIQIFLIAAVGSVYGLAYWPHREHPEEGAKVRVFYGLATSGMALLVIARNTIVFLAGWEIMALAAFMLVSADDRKPEVREAGLVYLISTRFGTLCLFGFFSLLWIVNGSFELGAPSISSNAPIVTAMMVLALLGFGLKAGAMPLHLWLPGAHSQAPTHVSALMSGVLIKMGIYGLVRFVMLFPSPPQWWGLTVLSIGVVSGVLGVAFAIGQHDLKRLLAYHSVENIGIILMSLGIGLLGRACGNEAVFALGLAGALLHTWNHGLFKALLFLSAGSVIHATHTREIDQLGGLARRMPYTAAAFIVGAVAICGLPPLNGFVSEMLAYLAFLKAATQVEPHLWPVGAVAAPALALIGGLALACFVKVVGAVFLGEPRTAHAADAHENGRTMLVPMALLAVCCAAIGLGPGLVAPTLDAVVHTWPSGTTAPALASLAPFRTLSIVGAGLVLSLAVGIAWARREGARGETPTWDCGYAAPSARMQYTSSSFADLLVGMFASVLRRERHAPGVTGLFPGATHFESHVPEIVLDRAVMPAARLVGRGLGSFRFLQRGSVHAYLLYVLAALLIALLVWR